MLEGGLAATYGDRFGRDDDLIDDEAKIGAAERRVVLPETLADYPGEARQGVVCDLAARLGELLLKAADLDSNSGQPRTMGLQTLAELRIAGAELAHLDELEEAHLLALDPGLLGFASLQSFAALGERAVGAVQHRFQKEGQALGREDLVLQRRDDNVVHLLHRHRRGGAGVSGDRPFPVADQVAILAALAGPQDHAGAAAVCAALGETGGQRRRVDRPGRRHLRMVLGELCLHLLEIFGADDRGHLHRHPFFLRAAAASAAVGLVIVMNAAVGRPTQDVVNGPGAEGLATDQKLAPIELGGDGDHPGLAVIAFPFEVEIEDQPDDLRFSLVDDELLLILLVQTGSDDCPVSKGRRRAVPEAARGITGHCHLDGLGVHFRLIGVDHGRDPAGQVAGRTIPDLLGYGLEAHARIFQLPAIAFEVEVIAIEAAEVPDQDEIEIAVGTLGVGDHLKENGPAIVAGGGARLEVDAHDLDAMRGGMVADPLLLLLQRYLVLGLPPRGHADIADCSSFPHIQLQCPSARRHLIRTTPGFRHPAATRSTPLRPARWMRPRTRPPARFGHATAPGPCRMLRSGGCPQRDRLVT
nr:hypothetical protein [Sphingomonas sp. ID1715]